MSTEIDVLRIQIERKRRELYNTIDQHDVLFHESIVEKSRELDNLLVIYQRKQLSKKVS